MKIINKLEPKDVITLDEAIDAWLKEGYLVCVYCGQTSILGEVNTPESERVYGHRFSYGFIEPKLGGIHTRTDAANKEEALERIKKRIKEAVESGESNFYYFPTLPDFARAVLENGWK